MQRQGKKQQPQAAAFSAAGNSSIRRKMQRHGKKQQHKQQHLQQHETAGEIVQNICAVGERKLQSWQGNGKETA